MDCTELTDLCLCADYGSVGLILDASSTACQGTACTMADAATCCHNPYATCDSHDAGVLCSDYAALRPDSYGTIPEASEIRCHAAVCTKAEDATTCCLGSPITLSGTDGTPGIGADRDFNAAWDGDAASFFDCAAPAGGFTQAFFPSRQLCSIKYLPRPGFAVRMNEGQFFGITEAGNEDLLATIGEPPQDDAWTEAIPTHVGPFVGVKYQGSVASYSNVAEIMLFGCGAFNQPLAYCARIGDFVRICTGTRVMCGEREWRGRSVVLTCNSHPRSASAGSDAEINEADGGTEQPVPVFLPPGTPGTAFVPACFEGLTIQPNGICTTQCPHFYVPRPATLACRNGVLEPRSFSCRRPCAAPLGILNAVAQRPCKEGAVISDQSFCTPLCTPGYHASHPNITALTALYCDDGILKPSTFSCNPEDCTLPLVACLQLARSPGRV